MSLARITSKLFIDHSPFICSNLAVGFLNNASTSSMQCNAETSASGSNRHSEITRMGLICLFPLVPIQSCSLHTTSSLHRLIRYRDRRDLLRGAQPKDEGVSGSVGFWADPQVLDGIFPTLETQEQMFDGVMYKDLPVCYIRTSSNNTLFGMVDSKGKTMVYNSCGIEGFKNARKGTNVAAQATAVSFAFKCIRKGVNTCKIKIKGLGPGRMAAMKGFQMAGLNVVSITDITKLPEMGPRPRRPKSL